MSETSRSRRRPAGRTGEGGRRLHSAGSAVIVSLGALGVALFLNAPGLHKSATTQPPGWKRDVALALTARLESVSHAVLLDRPRKTLKSALGRSGDDVIDTVVAAPQDQGSGSRAQAGSQPPPPPKRERFTPGRPLRIWIAGDSLVIVPGESLLRAAAENPAIAPDRNIEGRLSTGLERPDVYNWFTRVRYVMRKEKPGAVVVMFGGNDDHGYMTGLPPGESINSFGSQAWRKEYRHRVATIMDTIIRSGAYVVWVGLPITQSADRTRRYDTINAIVQSEAAKRPRRATYLDTYFFFAGKDGGYAQYVESSSGKLVKMRADDGVHFERPAGDLIAAKVLQMLEERFDLTSWRSRATSSVP